MVFDWEKCIDVGDFLKNYSQKEEYQRYSVNRYYYACFNLVREYFESYKYKLFSPNIHDKLIEGLSNFMNEYELELSLKMSKLRDYRVNADYHENFRPRNLKKSQKTANEILTLLNLLKNC